MSSAVYATVSYIPPGARTTAAAAAGATTTAKASISFASQAGKTGAGTATSSALVADATGGVDSSSLLQYFTRPYLDAHTLSKPTWRYAYILWFAIMGILVLWSLAYHLSGSSTRTGGSALGAWFRKWSIRRITWTKRVGAGGTAAEKGETAKGTGRKKVVWASPTVAQMIAVATLIVIAILASFLGDDYIKPTACTFGGECGFSGSSGPPKSNYRFKRGVNNPNGWAPFNDPLLAASNVNIAANAWSAAARLGLISYAMLPLVVTLALKQWPFNIWATPFLTNYHFDKTAILHRWSGRVVWLFSTGHAIGWMWQLTQDRDPFGRMVLIPVFGWYRFVCGVVCWFLLTFLTALSFKPLRKKFYELFYWSHIVLVIGVLVTAIVHHQPLMYWPIAALAWWGAERAFRFAALLYLNGILEGIWFKPSRASIRARSSNGGSFAEKSGDYALEQPFAIPGAGADSTQYPPVGFASPQLAAPYTPSVAPSSPTLYAHPTSPGPQQRLAPPGFATAQLLPGRTVRLSLHVPHALRWAPGQHVLLYVPGVRALESHPYTIAGVDPRASSAASKGKKAKGSEVVLLVRAQKGFSRALWDHVAAQRRRVQHEHEATTLRALVSWPMGSAGRANWGAFESLMIVCGGTGISFGISVLENACTRLVEAQRDGDKRWRGTRVRFVWIMREYAHLSWVASTLRRCIEMCDSAQLQVDLFVTHDAPKAPRRPHTSHKPYSSTADDELAPPSAPFARGERSGSRGRGSIASELSDWSDSDVEGTTPSSSPRASFARRPSQPTLPDEYDGEVESVTDLVLFDGEDDYRSPGEANVSAELKKQGKLRRALSRRGQGGTLRRPQRAGGDAPEYAFPSTTAAPVVLPHDPSFEALPLDHHDEVDSKPAPHTSSPYGDCARPPSALSYGDLGQGRRADSFDYGSTYGFDDEVQTLGGGDAGASRHNLVKAAQRPGVTSSSRRSSHVGALDSLAGAGARADAPASTARDDVEGGLLDVTSQEQEDLEAVAELAKTGYPRLKAILDDEVERSTGKTCVACCGPSSLNSIVRNLVASRIDLKRVAKGDPRGQVSLVVEDFSS
ncbi:hypothetical protein JCM8208_007549 [Rhodotorula glutinis]